MKKNEKNTKFALTDELISETLELVKLSDEKSIVKIFSNYHHADIAEVLEELNSDDATYIIKLLDSEKTSDVLMELDDDYREKILKNLSIQEIAEEVEELDSDDATDIISELPEEKQKKVISKISDAEHKADIKELLKYDEDSAGGLMAKELIKVNPKTGLVSKSNSRNYIIEAFKPGQLPNKTSEFDIIDKVKEKDIVNSLSPLY